MQDSVNLISCSANSVLQNNLTDILYSQTSNVSAMNTFGLYVSIILAVIAAINCAPGDFKGFNDDESVQQQRSYLDQLLNMMGEEVEDKEFVREDEAEEEGFNDDESIQQQQPDLNQLLKMMGEEAPDEAFVREDEAEEEGFNNHWDRPLHVQCNVRGGHAFSRVKSVYSTGHRDRRWEWSCSKVSDTALSECRWSPYLNNWDQPVAYSCPQDFVMSGIYSVHLNSKEDRRWRVMCCRAKGYQTESCELSNQFINGMRGQMDFEVHCEQQTKKRAFTGLYSYHDNKYQDRRWKIYQCEYKKE